MYKAQLNNWIGKESQMVAVKTPKGDQWNSNCMCMGGCAQVLVRISNHIKIFVVHPTVCLSVTDVGVATTNLRVVCKIITCVSASTEIAIIFS